MTFDRHREALVRELIRLVYLKRKEEEIQKGLRGKMKELVDRSLLHIDLLQGKLSAIERLVKETMANKIRKQKIKEILEGPDLR